MDIVLDIYLGKKISIKMHKICILTLYFGSFPNYFGQWLKSCGWNPSVDFLIVTDQDIPEKYDNVKVLKTNLSEVKKRFDRILNYDVALEYPYKLCDYKPMYGLVFEEQLKEYDFWGHCDVDLVWGDLSKFITPDILDNYDKIFPLGHLSVYRNNENVNNYFRLSGSLRGNIDKVARTNKSCVFDERFGINKIFEYNSLPLYSKEVAADISFRNQRMLIAGSQNHNYRHQAFYINDGKCFRAYVDGDNEVRHDEFAYIHLQKRHYINTTEDSSYFVAQNEFLPFEMPITKELIDKINPSRSPFLEKMEYFFKDYRFRINRRFKQLFIK